MILASLDTKIKEKFKKINVPHEVKKDEKLFIFIEYIFFTSSWFSFGFSFEKPENYCVWNETSISIKIIVIIIFAEIVQPYCVLLTFSLLCVATPLSAYLKKKIFKNFLSRETLSLWNM